MRPVEALLSFFIVVQIKTMYMLNRPRPCLTTGGWQWRTERGTDRKLVPHSFSRHPPRHTDADVEVILELPGF